MSATETETGIDSIGTGTMSADGTATESESMGQAAVLYLLVEPPEAILELDIGASASLPYTVTAVYADGSTSDVTAQASWSVSAPELGAMNGSTFESAVFPDSTFASTILTATVGGDEGQAQVTVAAYRLDSDFFFVLPWEDEAGEQAKPLTFSTDVKSMDVFVNMDTTASMDGAIANLQNAMVTNIIPAIQDLVPDTQFGVGGFEDFPVMPHGIAATDQPFELFQPITDDSDAVDEALLSLEVGDGNDPPEANFEALYQIATGEGLSGPGATMVAENHDGIGGVGFREGSLPVIVSITNAVSHDTVDSTCDRLYSPEVAAVAHSREQTVAALDAICARVVQIALSGGSCSAMSDGRVLAEATGAVIPPEAWDIGGRPDNCADGECCTGPNSLGVAPNTDGMCPMSYQAQFNGVGVGSSFSSAIQLVAAYGQFGVTSLVTGVDADIDGQPLPPGTSTADFIKAVTPLDHGPVPLPGAPEPSLGPTAFENVIPNTDVIFEIRAFNDFVEQGDQPRVFEANIEVLADDCGELDQRAVYILVPPMTLAPPA
ncbi:vWA domain-containing protein [Paraliomyxa miuraensis]|uniref:hypothetical protein n=1 Tax=Paraliomyxa miuraensis TaxID=376150 RepID=UPI00224D93E7|nr:hypothetical protein [Paraliomyxa miuraensis]MCX4245391.1 hypothetical protein [Paraliomyxa miuraensis]